jgi:hypothetical protein
MHVPATPPYCEHLTQARAASLHAGARHPLEARGCRVQIGSDMLFEQIPAYLEFFGLPSTSAEVLRAVARL